MKLDDIQEMIINDSKVDITNLAEESIRAIALHSKYLQMYHNEKRLLILIDESFRKLKLQKIEYYLGKADDSVYIDNPLNLKVQRQDLDYYLDADDELCDLKRKVLISQNKVELIKNFIEHNLNQRSHHFRNTISFLNWSQGK